MSNESSELTPAQRLEAAENRVTELEAAQQTAQTEHQAALATLEQERDTAVTDLATAQARIAELEAAQATLTEERDTALADLTAAREEAAAATQRAEAAEGRLAADPRFAHSGGEQTAPPSGSGEGEAQGDAEWHKAYMSEPDPAKRAKMWRERQQART